MLLPCIPRQVLRVLLEPQVPQGLWDLQVRVAGWPGEHACSLVLNTQTLSLYYDVKLNWYCMYSAMQQDQQCRTVGLHGMKEYGAVSYS